MCSCIEEMNRLMAEKGSNTKLCITFNGMTGQGYPTIQTEKANKKRRERPALAIPSYCPFCGGKYESRVAIIEREAG